MSKKASDFQKKIMSLSYRGKEIFISPDKTVKFMQNRLQFSHAEMIGQYAPWEPAH